MDSNALVERLEFLVGTVIEGDRTHAPVAALASGGYVAIWDSKNQDGNRKGVRDRQ